MIMQHAYIFDSNKISEICFMQLIERCVCVCVCVCVCL